MTLHVKTAADTFRGSANTRFFNENGWHRNARQVNAREEAARIKAARERKASVKTASVAEQLGTLRSEGKVRDITVPVPATATPAAVELVSALCPHDAEVVARYMGMTVASLRGIARDRGLKGYGKLRKADLAAALAR